MSRISAFFGIVIYMYWNEGSHQEPHFHAHHGERVASVRFDGSVISGSLSSRDVQLVREWALLHRDELDRNWRRGRAATPFENIAPLS